MRTSTNQPKADIICKMDPGVFPPTLDSYRWVVLVVRSDTQIRFFSRVEVLSTKMRDTLGAKSEQHKVREESASKHTWRWIYFEQFQLLERHETI